MKKICENCFEDKELRGFILSEGSVDLCDCCGEDTNLAISIKELRDFFSELLDNFESNPTGTSLVSLIQGDWSLFRNIDVGFKVLNFFIDDLGSTFNNADVPVSYSQDIRNNIGYWSQLKEQLKWERRYLVDINYLTDELSWDAFFESQVVINKDDILYRARLHQSGGAPAYKKSEMFCPPKEMSRAGRANPMGIPYLYLSDNEETILYEIRAAHLDEVSVAKFRVKQDLRKDVVISDFSENPTIYHPSEINKRIKSRLLKRSISRDLSQPIRRYDSTLDYIPTQFICEFIKVYTNVDGIKFRSSLHNKGNNYVIFDQEVMKCIEVNKVIIPKFKINFINND